MAGVVFVLMVQGENFLPHRKSTLFSHSIPFLEFFPGNPLRDLVGLRHPPKNFNGDSAACQGSPLAFQPLHLQLGNLILGKHSS